MVGRATSNRKFRLFYSVLQREDHFHLYSNNGGEYRAYDNNVDKTKFGQFYISLWFTSYGTTVYGEVS